MTASKQKKFYSAISQYFAFGCLLCLIYSFQVSFRSLVHIDTIVCDVPPSQQKQQQSEPVSHSQKSSRTSKADFKAEESSVSQSLNLSMFTRTDYFGCEDFAKLPVTIQSRPENVVGNRGISFMKVRINGVTIPAVYKEANRNLRRPSVEYKYHMAMKEIEYLEKLRGLPGVPHIFGSCIRKSSVTYIVERIVGSTFCNDKGIGQACYRAKYLIKAVNESSDPQLSALKLTYSTVKLFRLLEERHLFFEDISGVNLIFTSDFDVYLIDADSLVFYNEKRLYSGLTCQRNRDCSGPVGNLWVSISLNARIYSKCNDLAGICEDGMCRGFDVGLHACGLAHWYICDLIKFFKNSPDIHSEFQLVCDCMSQKFPQQRCSFAFAQEKMKMILSKYLK